MDKQELKTHLQGLIGKTVARKANQKISRYTDKTMAKAVTHNATQDEKVKGTVVGYSARQRNGEWKVKLTVEWEGATNGAIRWGGGKWNTTSKINLNSLVIL